MGDKKDTRSQATSSILDAMRKRRKLAVNNASEVDPRLIANKERCKDHNMVEEEKRDGEIEQFQAATEEYGNNEDNNAHDNPAEQIVASEAVEADIQQIREKMKRFTRQVSGLLEAGKNFFIEMSNEFEEHIVLIHQKQINKWQEEVQLLRTIDSLNEDMSSRLHDAQCLLHTVQMDS